MNQIAALLDADRIVLDLAVDGKAGLFDAVGTLFEHAAGLSGAAVAQSLATREKLGSTGIGQGIAIPHGRIRKLPEATGAFVRVARGIDFGAPDGKPVSLVFVLLVPEQATDRHLALLSELAQMFSERSFRERIAVAPDAAALLRVFAEWQPRGGSEG
jgi:PTS system nitrogen regulatory IIA component